ncbi:HAMP domain-containing sensor histidine kinase [Paludibacter sp.]
MSKFSFSTKTISYIVFISIVLILSAQSYLVYDYFQTVRYSLIRETDSILKEAFRNELNQRNTKYALSYTDSLVVESEVSDPNVLNFDMRGVETDNESVLNRLDIVLHQFLSSLIPINIQKIDSVTGDILKNRGINSEFLILLLNPSNEEVIDSTKDLYKNSFFTIPSKPYPLDFENKQALQLILINPFSEIIKRMGLMLIGSILFSIIALLAFRFLINTLLKQKKLVKFKNEFLSNIAHELKRPVSSLVVNLDCLREPMFFDNTEMRDTMLNNSINSLTELNGTINMIVGLAKVEEGLLVINKLPVNLIKVINDLKSRFVSSPAKKIIINTSYESNEIIVNADGLMLTQCFANLIDNSIKYSKQNVVIDVSISITTSWIELNFKDNGIGIPDDKISTIFEKYSRVDNNAKVNGFGIGLNYVKTIIEKHGGKISVTSELGVGSNFKIQLPKK